MGDALKDALLLFLHGQTLAFSPKYCIKPPRCKIPAYPERISMSLTSASLGADEPALTSPPN